MAGLISDIGSVVKSFGSTETIANFGSDLLSNTAKSLGLIDSDNTTSKAKPTAATIQKASDRC